MATPLPTVDSTDVLCAAGGDPRHLEAYAICLKYEEELATSKNKLRHVRIVGFLLLHSPSQGVLYEIIRYIHSHKDSNDIIDLGRSFERDVIWPLARSTSEPKGEGIFDSNTDDITQAPKGRGQAKYRALRRDGWRCVVTGMIDLDSGVDLESDPETYGIYTHCCYIVPVALLLKRTENDRSSPPIAVLRREICTAVGENVHSLKNVFSMEVNSSDRFYMLQMYFEATPQQDTYQVAGSKLRMGQYCVREHVTFSTSDPVNLPVPAPELLAFHAAFCKVARLSGVIDHVNSLPGDRIR